MRIVSAEVENDRERRKVIARWQDLLDQGKLLKVTGVPPTSLCIDPFKKGESFISRNLKRMS
jgi:hypothetical protein